MTPGIWIIAEQLHGQLLDVSFELLTRAVVLARQRQAKLSAVVFSSGMSDTELQRLIDSGAHQVLAVEAAVLADFDLDNYAAALRGLIQHRAPEIILAAATSLGRTLMPYVAMTAHAGLTADCTELEIEPATGLLLQTRPAIGGNIMATIRCPVHRPQMATVRPKSCCAASPGSGNGEVVRIHHEACISRIRRVGFKPVPDDDSIQNAEKLVVVGRGIKKPENIKLARDLANALGASLGATREVIDRGWMSYPHQVGLSGKTVTPKLYIGIGVSGAVQHLAGMQTAATIIAINNDPEAQIFKVADFGIAGNLFDVVPALTRKIAEGKCPWKQ